MGTNVIAQQQDDIRPIIGESRRQQSERHSHGKSEPKKSTHGMHLLMN
jgi:hypothetical protein